MKLHFLGLMVGLVGTAGGAQLEMTAESLRRADLPNNFPFQILNEGFAIIRVTLRNTNDVESALDFSGFSCRGPGNKKLKRALPTEITPKLMKYYQGGTLGIHGEVRVGRQPNPNDLRRPPTVSGAPTVSGDRTGTAIDVSTGSRLRAILEEFELSDDPLAGGDTREGFIYLKSKKSGTRLRGSSVQLQDARATIP